MIRKSNGNRRWRWDLLTPESCSYGLSSKCFDLFNRKWTFLAENGYQELSVIVIIRIFIR
jgi:hypothetical protein